MNRKSLSFRVAAVLLIGATTAWVIDAALDPSPPPRVAGSKPERGGRSPSSPREARPAFEAEPTVNPEGDRTHASVAEAPRERPRAASEWQGMKVDDAETWPCGEGCGMARACVRGECAPCLEDGECESGEVCVLDHCVLEKLAECRVAADCGDPEALCVLTGYTSGDLRGNSDMRAHCSHPEGGRPDDLDEVADEGAARGEDEDDGAVAAASTADRPPPGSSIIDELRHRARHP